VRVVDDEKNVGYSLIQFLLTQGLVVMTEDRDALIDMLIKIANHSNEEKVLTEILHVALLQSSPAPQRYDLKWADYDKKSGESIE